MSDVELKLTADLDEALKEVSGFRKEYAEMVRAVEKPIKQIDALQNTQATAKKAAAEFFAARRRVDELKQAIQAAGQPVKAFDRDLKQAERSLAATTREFDRQKAKIREQRAELRAAGVDVRNLAGEQKRLQSELGKQLTGGRADTGFQAALQNLGVAQSRASREAVVEQQRQFELLRKSGKLSATEIALAQNTLRQSIGAASRQVSGLTAATTTWQAALVGVRAELIAGAAAFGGFALVAGQSFTKFADYEQRIAEIGTITDLTGSQLQNLSGDVRQLSLDMGKDAAGSAAALYEILSSGVSTENSIGVLGESTKAAVAGLTDTKTAATVGLAVINSYGEGVDQLGKRYDQLFLTVKNGVVTFPELAQSIGQVLPTAKAADVSFAEVSAAIAEMTKQGLRAPIAVTGLRGAINQLAAPGEQAADAMAELGIEWNGLVGTLQQIADKKVGFEALRQIIPDTEGRTAVLALTRDIGSLVAQVELMEEAGGTTQSAYEKMKDTPAAQMERFRAAVGELQLAFGEAVAAGLPLIQLFTEMLNSFNSLPESLRVGLISIVALGAGTKALSILVKGLKGPFSLFLSQLGQVPASAGAAGAAIDVLGGRIGKFNKLSLGSALKGAGVLAVAGFTATQLAELYAVYEQMQELEQAQEEQAESLQVLINKNYGYKDALVENQQAVGEMAQTEKRSYVERLKSAETYYAALSEQLSRSSDPAAPVSEEALDASRKASAYRRAREAVEAELDAETKSRTAFDTKQKTARKNALADIQQNLAAQVQAYETANKALENARKRRADIEQEFAALANDLGSGGPGGPDFGAATVAGANARQALQAGDTETAISEARRAGSILKELKSAGENTYGFKGIADELSRIASAAAQIDEENAKAEVDQIASVVDDLTLRAEALKTIQVGFVSDEESEAAVRERLISLAGEWAKYLQIPVTPVIGDKDALGYAFVPNNPPLPGLATGGWTGPGTKYQPAGIVHADEHVQPKRIVNEPGALSFLEQIRRNGFRNTISQLQASMASRLTGYAEGGPVSARALPAIPTMSPALMQSANPLADWGRATLDTAEGSLEVLMREDSFGRLLSRTALKHGRTR
ncbi:phage tail tape measure protein [uncultured Pseudomonas sp.]|uniref:phage tail tape measure protein n=1 Tax=uncultured Pseudomonas sp. TaxID=114707 RepID=UPI0030D75BED|tara:strand:+ start:5634 stop:8921 length:3288 start_codon:yes stop_codon:yes gene_type:complete